MRMGCDSSDLRVSECISDALEVSKKVGPSQKEHQTPKGCSERHSRWVPSEQMDFVDEML